MSTSKPEPSREPAPPHGALGEIREDIFIPPEKSHLRVPIPKSQPPTKPTRKKVRRSTRR